LAYNKWILIFTKISTQHLHSFFPKVSFVAFHFFLKHLSKVHVSEITLYNYTGHKWILVLNGFHHSISNDLCAII
jgi:hypothetical protein